MTTLKRIGLIVNPIAGMGGRVGLKGTDGAGAEERARALGATPLSGERAAITLGVLTERFGGHIEVLAPAGLMGATVVSERGVIPVVLGAPAGVATGPEDTRLAAQEMVISGVDLLLFAGGDGTARDIYGAVGNGPPVLGIPTGVKMHSAVYATTPRAAGELAATFLAAKHPLCREAEVMDIDEEAFRAGRVSARLFGYLNVPFQRNLVQGLKAGSGAGEGDLAGIASDIAERMGDGALWIVGPGTTTRAIAERLGVNKTLLGVDLYSRGEVIALDATERDLLRHLDGTPARIVVTPIGGQGYLFGRGNQQFSPEVIRRVGMANIIVVATMAKLTGLGNAPLLVDTGDAELDRELAGYVRVVTGYHQESVQRVG